MHAPRDSTPAALGTSDRFLSELKQVADTTQPAEAAGELKVFEMLGEQDGAYPRGFRNRNS
jgi:hypothetical protein